MTAPLIPDEIYSAKVSSIDPVGGLATVETGDTLLMWLPDTPQSERAILVNEARIKLINAFELCWGCSVSVVFDFEQASTGMIKNGLFHETLYHNFGQTFKVEELLLEYSTPYWDMVIFKNKAMGTVMAMDGIVQVTTRDEAAYHEMLTHVPLAAFASPANEEARSVLVIGGGDGGIIREACKHRNLERITLVEIDPEVVNLCQRYMPELSDGAFNDPRVELVIADATKFVKECRDKYDVIISDCTDPVEFGSPLFGAEFMADCKKLLTRNGIFVSQNGVPFLQSEEIEATYVPLKSLYKDAGFFTTSVPTYVGGVMAFAWATDDEGARSRTASSIRSYMETLATLDLKYYTPELHVASFALPRFVHGLMETALEESAHV